MERLADRLPNPERSASELADTVPDRAPGTDARRGERYSADSPPDPDLPYWQKVEYHDALWERHVERWPDPPSRQAADRARPDDPPGSWRGDGNRYLTPEQNAEADRLIGELRQPEKAVTALLVRIQQDNQYGARLEGLGHRLKGTNRLKEKFADKMGVKADVGPAEAAATINDAVRYTFSLEGEKYVDGYWDVRQQIESAGYRLTHSWNHWLDADPEYKGINTRWLTPDGGRFELQFHTWESYDAKENRTHRSYDRLRMPTVSRPEQRELMQYQRLVCAAVPDPRDIGAIPHREGLT